MKAQTQGALHRLKDSGLELADPVADIRDRKVLDASDQQIGTVEDLLIDETERRVRFIEAGSGGFLGIGETKFLLPVEAVTRITKDAVKVNQRGERVAAAPKYNPELIERDYLGDLYGYYGYRTPFWDRAYVYPSSPYL